MKTTQRDTGGGAGEKERVSGVMSMIHSAQWTARIKTSLWGL